MAKTYIKLLISGSNNGVPQVPFSDMGLLQSERHTGASYDSASITPSNGQFLITDNSGGSVTTYPVKHIFLPEDSSIETPGWGKAVSAGMILANKTSLSIDLKKPFSLTGKYKPMELLLAKPADNSSISLYVNDPSQSGRDVSDGLSLLSSTTQSGNSYITQFVLWIHTITSPSRNEQIAPTELRITSMFEPESVDFCFVKKSGKLILQCAIRKQGSQYDSYNFVDYVIKDEDTIKCPTLIMLKESQSNFLIDNDNKTLIIGASSNIAWAGGFDYNLLLNGSINDAWHTTWNSDIRGSTGEYSYNTITSGIIDVNYPTRISGCTLRSAEGSSDPAYYNPETQVIFNPGFPGSESWLLTSSAVSKEVSWGAPSILAKDIITAYMDSASGGIKINVRHQKKSQYDPDWVDDGGGYYVITKIEQFYPPAGDTNSSSSSSSGSSSGSGNAGGGGDSPHETLIN